MHTHIAIYPQGGKKKEKAEKNSSDVATTSLKIFF